MNRDESRTRAPECAPAVRDGNPAWLAPSDSARGGSWIGVNACGVVACIMNGYANGDIEAHCQTADIPTRGAIVQWALVRGGPADVRRAFERDFDPAPYPSFTLVLAHAGAVESLVWDAAGSMRHERHPDEWSFFSSSSWKTDEVIAWRRRAFETWRSNGCALKSGLPAIHLLQEDGLREWSPLMDRERTCTRSITQVELDGGGASMRYWRRDALDAGQPPILANLPLQSGREHARHD